MTGRHSWHTLRSRTSAARCFRPARQLPMAAIGGSAACPKAMSPPPTGPKSNWCSAPAGLFTTTWGQEHVSGQDLVTSALFSAPIMIYYDLYIGAGAG
jgi:hypothetical protein